MLSVRPERPSDHRNPRRWSTPRAAPRCPRPTLSRRLVRPSSRPRRYKWVRNSTLRPGSSSCRRRTGWAGSNSRNTRLLPCKRYRFAARQRGMSRERRTRRRASRRRDPRRRPRSRRFPRRRCPSRIDGAQVRPAYERHCGTRVPHIDVNAVGVFRAGLLVARRLNLDHASRVRPSVAHPSVARPPVARTARSKDDGEYRDGGPHAHHRNVAPSSIVRSPRGQNPWPNRSTPLG
jgi:hypothetical protein